MFIKENNSIMSSSDELHQFYTNEYPMYKEEFKRQIEKEVKRNLERPMFM